VENPLKYPEKNFIKEIVLTASRSSGPGGQHVNKVNTRVELRFNVEDTSLLSEDDKTMLIQKIGNKINSHGELIIVSEKYRSQLKNKELVIKKFFELLEIALTPPKKRIPVKLSEAKKKKRLEDKKKRSDKKERRKPPDVE
jgi:ribosome-associated protein